MKFHPVSHKNESGAIFLAGVLIVTFLGTAMGLFSWYALTKQTGQARKINAQHQHKAIMEAIVSRLVDDLRIAKNYPEARGLPNPPTRSATITPRCPTNNDLDQYLRTTCVSPTDTDLTKRTNIAVANNTQKNLNPLVTPCPKTGLAGSSCYRYDIGDFYVPVSVDTLWGFPLFPANAQPAEETLYVVPETAPVVTLTKVAANQYRAEVTASVCKRLVVGRGSPPLNGTGGWESAGNPPAWTVACPAADLVPMVARVFINTARNL